MTARIADAALDGLNMRKDQPAPAGDEDHYGEPEARDEDLLGPAIRAKMASGELEFTPAEESASAE
jgi:hypothetical protein